MGNPKYLLCNPIVGYNIGHTPWPASSGYADLSFVEGMLRIGVELEKVLIKQNQYGVGWGGVRQGGGVKKQKNL